MKNSYLTVTDHLFDDDALVIGMKSLFVTWKMTVTMDAPLFGVWSSTFICVEPDGRCDSADFTGDLKDREWGNLDIGKPKRC